jgi:hypothetical protein
MIERELRRYSAYFRGWCQAFGEHENLSDHDNGIHWLIAEHQAGFVLPQAMIRRLYREVLLHQAAPPMIFHDDTVEVGGFHFPMTRQYETRILDSIENILTHGSEFHTYLTSHLMYGTKARIFTLSLRKPIAIIYKEIGTIRLRLDRSAPPRPGTTR